GGSPATPAQLIHDRSSTVLPLPGDADTTLTRARAANRPNSRGRPTTPPVPGPSSPPATEAAPATDLIVQIIAPHQPAWPTASCQSLDVRRTTIPHAGPTCAPSPAPVFDHRLNAPSSALSPRTNWQTTDLVDQGRDAIAAWL